MELFKEKACHEKGGRWMWVEKCGREGLERM